MTDFIVTIWAIPRKDDGRPGRRADKIGSIAFPSRGMAEHIASTIAANSTDQHEFNTSVNLAVRVPGYGRLVIDPFAVEDAIEALNQAQKDWNNAR